MTACPSSERMAGPALSIELDGPVSEIALAELRDLLADVSSHLETKRRGFFDLQVAPDRRCSVALFALMCPESALGDQADRRRGRLGSCHASRRITA